MFRPIFYTTKPLKQLLVLLFTLFASFIVFAIVSSIGMIAFPKNLNNDTFPIEFTQYLLVVQGLTIMILPSIVFTFLTNLKPWESIGLQKIRPLKWILLSIVIILSVQPLVEWLSMVNSQMSLPASMAGIEAWMREAEIKAAEITAEILKGNQPKNIIANIFIMAIIPAIGEELIFRGCFQKVLGQWWKNPHLAIFVTAILFSAIHMQFFGFLPRFVLGMVLGYLFYWSKNIWVSILAHFINNALAVSLYYYYIIIGGIENPLAPQEAAKVDYIVLTAGSTIFVASIFLSYKLYKAVKKRRLQMV